MVDSCITPSEMGNHEKIRRGFFFEPSSPFSDSFEGVAVMVVLGEMIL